MKGYQLTFFLQQDRKHGFSPLSEWLLQAVRKLGIGGATVIPATEGFGHHHKIHSAHFFDLADQPLEVTMALSDADAARVFQLLREEGVDVFYVKTAIDFGMSSEV
ncbi:MAG: DUF190 domain-containing protein [Pseudomonadota bacterium]